MLINNSIDIDESVIGTVLGYDLDSREIYVTIPKYMMGLNSTELHNNKISLNKSNIQNINNLNLSDYINKTNYIIVKPKDYSDPIPEIGSHVVISFIENNIQNAVYEKFNPNNDYQVIESERYPKYFNLSVGDKTVEVKDSDTITINVPEDYKVIYIEEDKSKTFNLIENENVDLTISELKSSVEILLKNMKYLVKKEKETAIETLESIKSNLDLLKSEVLDNLNSIKNSLISKINIRLITILNEIDFESINSTISEYNKKYTALQDIITKYEELNKFYENYYQENNKYPNEDYSDLVSLENLKEQIQSNYSAILNYSDLNQFSETITELLDKISTTKNIKFNYEQNLIKTLDEAKLLSDIDFPKNEDLADYISGSYAITGYFSDEFLKNKYDSTKVTRSMNLYIDVLKYNEVVLAIEDPNDTSNYDFVIFDETDYPSYINHSIQLFIDGNELEYDSELGAYLVRIAKKSVGETVTRQVIISDDEKELINNSEEFTLADLIPKDE